MRVVFLNFRMGVLACAGAVLLGNLGCAVSAEKSDAGSVRPDGGPDGAPADKPDGSTQADTGGGAEVGYVGDGGVDAPADSGSDAPPVDAPVSPVDAPVSPVDASSDKPPDPPDSWPFGANGDLVIRSGETVTLAAGQTRDYASLKIAAGGILEIVGPNDWTYIGVNGPVSIDGEIRAVGAEHTGGTFAGVAPDNQGRPSGDALSFAVLQRHGGAGGKTDLCNRPSIGGKEAAGNGGGGAGNYIQRTMDCTAYTGSEGADGAPATSTAGGAGGLAGSGPSPESGAGATDYGSDGTPGATKVEDTLGCGAGAGGGGGFRGRHGRPLYLKVRGPVSGTGKIVLRGDKGGRGGDGGEGTAIGQWAGGGGGGGGGGAGGDGGMLVVRYSQTFPLAVDVSGGPGGAGGAAGATPMGADDADGEAGQDGLAGLVDMRTF